MQETPNYLKGAFLSCLLLCTVSSHAFAQVTTENSGTKDDQPNIELALSEHSPAPVEIDGRPIFLVYGAIAGLSPEERASNIKQRILDFATQDNALVGSVHLVDHGHWTEILAGEKPIMGVSEYDARIAGRPRNDLAAEYTEIIQRTVTIYRQVHTWGNLIRAWIYTAVASAGLFVSMLLLIRARRLLRHTIQRWTKPSDVLDVSATIRLWSLRFLERSSRAIGRLLFWASLIGVLNIYVALVLSFYPASRYASKRIIQWLF